MLGLTEEQLGVSASLREHKQCVEPVLVATSLRTAHTLTLQATRTCANLSVRTITLRFILSRAVLRVDL